MSTPTVVLLFGMMGLLGGLLAVMTVCRLPVPLNGMLPFRPYTFKARLCDWALEFALTESRRNWFNAMPRAADGWSLSVGVGALFRYRLALVVSPSEKKTKVIATTAKRVSSASTTNRATPRRG